MGTRESARDRIARLTPPAPTIAHAHAPAHAPAHVPAHAPAHVPAHAHAHAHVHVQGKAEPMVRLHTLIDADQMAFLGRLANQQGIDRAVFVRHIIDYYREHGPLKEG